MGRIAYIAAMIAVLCSCTKEIDIDYHEIDAIPVIEGHLSMDSATVKITTTRNMDDSVKTAGKRVDDVRIVGPDGRATLLDYCSDGTYRPVEKITPAEGETYQLQVTIDGVVYSGSSTLMPRIEITEPQFLWVNFMDWMQVMEFETTNVPIGSEVYGWVRIHRNGEIYFSDAGRCMGDSPFDIGLYYDSDMENDEEMILYNGDKLRLEVRTIDENVYYYLAEYNNTKKNPKQFFTPSVDGKVCLGFFAVYDRVVIDMVYEKTAHE